MIKCTLSSWVIFSLVFLNLYFVILFRNEKTDNFFIILENKAMNFLLFKLRYLLIWEIKILVNSKPEEIFILSHSRRKQVENILLHLNFHLILFLMLKINKGWSLLQRRLTHWIIFKLWKILSMIEINKEIFWRSQN